MAQDLLLHVGADVGHLVTQGRDEREQCVQELAEAWVLAKAGQHLLGVRNEDLLALLAHGQAYV